MLLSNRDAVDPGSVGRPEVSDHDRLADPSDLGVPTADVGIREHDRTLGKAADHHRVAAESDAATVGQHQLGRREPLGALDDVSVHREATGPQARALEDLHVDGADEGVSLRLGVLAGCIAELSHQCVDERREPLHILRGERHREHVGRDEAPHAHAAVQVHFSRQPTPDLDRLEVAPKRLCQRPLHQTLEALLELLESHDCPKHYRHRVLTRDSSGREGRSGLFSGPGPWTNLAWSLGRVAE